MNSPDNLLTKTPRNLAKQTGTDSSVVMGAKAPLTKAIQEAAPALTWGEAEEAARNLAGFFSLLAEIDREQRQSAPAPSEGAR